MLPIHTILHPTDFSDHSGNALMLAASMARDYEARLVVLHVAHVPPPLAGEGMLPPSREEIMAEADEHLKRLESSHENIPMEVRLAEGSVVSEILRATGELKADVIVMGTHGRTGLGRFLMGSVAEQVVRRSPTPVVTVSKPFTPRAHTNLPEVVFAGAGA